MHSRRPKPVSKRLRISNNYQLLKYFCQCAVVVVDAGSLAVDSWRPLVVLCHSFRLLRIVQQPQFAAFDSLEAAGGAQRMHRNRLNVASFVVVADRIECCSCCGTYDSDVVEAPLVVVVVVATMVAIVSPVALYYNCTGHHKRTDRLRSRHALDQSDGPMAAATIPIQTQRLPEIYQNDDSTLHHRRYSAKI